MPFPLPTFAAMAVAVILAPGADAAGPAHPRPRFTQADRAARLAAAFPEIDRLMAARMDQDHLPGVAYGIVVDGELLHAKALGRRDLEARAAVDLDTAFRIASMTKSVTALAVLKLRDDGKLSLDDPVARHVEELAALPYPTRDSTPITIRQLLTHTGGFPEDNPWGDRQLAIGDDVMSRWMRASIPFSTPPGTAFEYSNYGFAILGQVIARVSGLGYVDYVDRHILQPLGMTATRWEAAAIPAAHLARGYQWKDGEWREVPQLADGAFGAMGGLYTTSRDLARYVAFLLSAWPARDDPESGPVRRSSAREMQQTGRFNGLMVGRASPEAPLRATAINYGYGIGFAQDCDARLVVSHSGGLPGFGSNMRLLPEHGVAVFVMANRTYAPGGGMAREAAEALARTGALRPRELPPSAPLVAARDAIDGLLARWDDARASAAAASNLFLDRPLPERRDEVARLRERHGACRPGAVAPENWLRGRFREECEKGWIDVDFTLAPTLPPRIQHLRLTSGLPPSERMAAAAKALAALAGGWSEATAAEVASSAVDLARLRSQLEAVGGDYGSCRAGEAIEGDGTRSSVVRLDCERGALDLGLDLDAAGRVSGARFATPRDATCVP
ncbi:MAG TPA: serine hydrolase domain-containing protein [Vicinamibacteria bacterium]|nr:serine hydrolase domain-containing protein [Vicinamibacteria bacterium]